MKKVSIVVPVYNGEKYLEQTIKMLLESTYKELEIIIVNDGSTDKSLVICEKLKATDCRVKVYTKENGGVANARNYGSSKATGDFLCFCDQDDIVEYDTYEKMVTCIEQNQSEICMCGTGRSIDGKKSIFERLENACYKGDEILSELLYPILFNGYNVPIKKSEESRYPHIWNCMFRMDFWKSNNFKFRIYVNFEDDLLMKIDTLTRAGNVSTINYTGYYWRVNLKSETYAHKYVEKIGEKQQKCFEYMKGCIERKVQQNEVLKLFEQVTLCKQYLDAVHNLTSPCKKKNIRFIKNYYKNMIYQRNFEENIQAFKYLKKGQVKPMILLPMLARKFTLLSYLTEKLLDYVLWITLHSQSLTKLERMLKK